MSYISIFRMKNTFISKGNVSAINGKPAYVQSINIQMHTSVSGRSRSTSGGPEPGQAPRGQCGPGAGARGAVGSHQPPPPATRSTSGQGSKATRLGSVLVSANANNPGRQKLTSGTAPTVRQSSKMTAVCRTPRVQGSLRGTGCPEPGLRPS